MTETESLLWLKAALESADMQGVEYMLAPDCTYVSTGRGTIGHNRAETMDFLITMATSIKTDHVPVIANVIRITEVYEEDAMFREGRYGLSISYDETDSYVYMLFVDVNDDGLVERIVSSQENYTIEPVNLRLLDFETLISFVVCPESVKDWVSALSVWLETEHFDVDHFYHHIDEDTKVVFQKGDAESITLETGLDVEDYFDQLMNQHFDAMPHIIRDEEDNLIVTYGPMSLIATLNDKGGLGVISIYIDDRDDDEADDYGYIEETLSDNPNDDYMQH